MRSNKNTVTKDYDADVRLVRTQYKVWPVFSSHMVRIFSQRLLNGPLLQGQKKIPSGFILSSGVVIRESTVIALAEGDFEMVVLDNQDAILKIWADTRKEVVEILKVINFEVSKE